MTKETPTGPQAQEAGAVVFRVHDSTFADPWSKWLPIEELHYYGRDGNLVQGPHPDWKVEYAYPATPARVVSDGIQVTDEMVDVALFYESND